MKNLINKENKTEYEKMFADLLEFMASDMCMVCERCDKSSIKDVVDCIKDLTLMCDREIDF